MYVNRKLKKKREGGNSVSRAPIYTSVIQIQDGMLAMD
jgi:hypothetical protein